MTPPFRAIVVMVFATAIAGAVGGLAGVVYGGHETHPQGNIDTVVPEELSLTREQNRRIGELEGRYLERQKFLHAEMWAANRDLAEALQVEHAYGPQTQAVMDRFHKAEEQLQIATIRHVLAMRAVLNPQQTSRFDDRIHTALATGS